jgi:hypothetical protein
VGGALDLMKVRRACATPLGRLQRRGDLRRLPQQLLESVPEGCRFAVHGVSQKKLRGFLHLPALPTA